LIEEIQNQLANQKRCEKARVEIDQIRGHIEEIES
jgi:hypothetical protein